MNNPKTFQGLALAADSDNELSGQVGGSDHTDFDAQMRECFAGHVLLLFIDVQELAVIVSHAPILLLTNSLFKT